MLALAESGPRRMVTADDIVEKLAREMKTAPKKQVIPPLELPSYRRTINVLKLAKMSILDLLHPDSGNWEDGSAEAEQMEALSALLGDSEELLDLTPRELSRALREKPWDGSFIDTSRTDSYHLRLLTNIDNAETGKRLYYSLTVTNAGQRRGVDIRQRLHSCDDDEINPRAQMLRRQFSLLTTKTA